MILGVAVSIRIALAIWLLGLVMVGITMAQRFEYGWGDAEVWIPTLTCLGTPFAKGMAA